MTVTVLIETYWNVKVLTRNRDVVSGKVLIETYWNVKSFNCSTNSGNKLRINRNILECKGGKKCF